MNFHDLILGYGHWSLISDVGKILLELGFLFLVLRVTMRELRIGKRSKEDIRNALGAAEPGFFSIPGKMEGSINGIPCECLYIQTSSTGNDPMFPQRKLRVRVLRPFSFDMRIKFKGKIEAIEEKIGLQPAIETGDSVLDKLYHISCNSRDTAQSYLADFRRREIVKEIFHAESLIGEIRLSHHGAEVMISEVGTKVDLELLKKIVGLLDRLAQS